MHLDFGGGLKTGVCLDDLALAIYLADVFRCHKTLADARRGAQEEIFANPDGDVSVVGGNHSFVINAFADFAYLFFNLILGSHNDFSFMLKVVFSYTRFLISYMGHFPFAD
jgi:hypothetical protein